jgi:hypothetical protein
MKTNLSVLMLVAMFAFSASIVRAQGVMDETVSEGGPAAPTLTEENLVNAIEGEWSPYGFVTRMKSGANGVIIGEVQWTVLTVNKALNKETLPPNRILKILLKVPQAETKPAKVAEIPKAEADPETEAKEKAAKAEADKKAKKEDDGLTLMNCLQASPFKANETEKNTKWDPTKPASCLVKVKFTKKNNVFVMDVTLASLQDAVGSGGEHEKFLMSHYKISREDARRFSPTAPIFLNTEFLREGLLDPFIMKEKGQFKDQTGSDTGSTKITPGKVVFWILWLIGMVLLGISLTWVTKKARHAVSGSEELGKLQVGLIILALIILGVLMWWLSWWGVFLIGIGLGGFLTFLTIISVGKANPRPQVAENSAEEEEEEDED